MNKKLRYSLIFLVVATLFGSFFLTSLNNKKQVNRTFTYSEEAIPNPLMGYAPSAEESELSDDVQLVYMDVTWKELEAQKGVYDWEKIEESNQMERWKKEGKYIVLRFVLDYPSNTSHEDIPSWLIKEMSDPGDRYESDYGKGFSPNYSDKTLISYYQKAVAAMGERWAKSGQIAFIQLGVLGHWGEWHVNDEVNIRKLPEAAVREKFITPWTQAFPKANILMRRPFVAAKKHGFGLYNDMVGEKESTKVWLDWIKSGGDYDQEEAKDGLVAMPDAWQTAPIGGEFTSAVSMKNILKNNLEQTIKEVQQSHTSFLGPKIAEVLDEKDDTGYNEVLKNMGYRLWVPSVSLKPQGDETKLTLTLANKGVAPFYRNWDTKIYVLDKSGEIVETKKLSLDLTKLLPDKEEELEVSLSTSDLMSKDKGYKVAIGIISPLTNQPSIRFANEGQEDQTVLTLYDAATDE